MSKKKIFLCILGAFVLLAVSLHFLNILFFKPSAYVSEVNQAFGIQIPSDVKQKEIYDTHDNFLGDGSSLISYTLLKKNEASVFEKTIQTWKPLPIDEKTIKCVAQDELNITDGIKQGYWKVVNRNPEDMYSNPHSYNFSIVIYDSEKHIIYYYKTDS